MTFDVAPFDEMVRLSAPTTRWRPQAAWPPECRRAPIVLSILKSLLETGQGIDVFAVFAKPTAVT